jgi:glutaredoxin 3
MLPITVYTSGSCPYCVSAKRLLEKKGLAYEEIYIDRELGARDIMMKKSGRRTVPQVFIGERHVGGFDDLSAAEKAGDLDRWLAED